MESVGLISLDPVRLDPFQSVMRLLHALTLCCLVCFSSYAGALENPLAGSLHDPWGIVSQAKNGTRTKVIFSDPAPRDGSPGSSSLATPREASTFGPTFESFQSQYISPLNLSNLGKSREDSFVTRYDSGAREWDTFQPNQNIFPAGTIFYGDPGALVATVGPPDPTIATTRWSTFSIYAFAFASLLLLLLLVIYFRMRYQAKYTSDH